MELPGTLYIKYKAGNVFRTLPVLSYVNTMDQLSNQKNKTVTKQSGHDFEKWSDGTDER